MTTPGVAVVAVLALLKLVVVLTLFVQNCMSFGFVVVGPAYGDIVVHSTLSSHVGGRCHPGVSVHLRCSHRQVPPPACFIDVDMLCG